MCVKSNCCGPESCVLSAGSGNVLKSNKEFQETENVAKDVAKRYENLQKLRVCFLTQDNSWIAESGGDIRDTASVHTINALHPATVSLLKTNLHLAPNSKGIWYVYEM